MNKIVFDFVLVILLFLFAWKVMGKGLINWLSPEKDVREPDVADPTNAEQLKTLRATLMEKKTKLKNKGEIEQVQKQLNEVNAKLADLA